ncbi:TetR/AcrR family transcriptional regulator [Baekduia sp. Peel2402]|uniref:TetR/AcrR family transcriptional regulator n=1 Tax=Baekduia sp. Peel2402 TaxID=3458296 RepID=UPI00403ED2C6
MNLMPSSGRTSSVKASESNGEVTAVREPPRTARGARTRAALVTAARTVFERDGYLNARLTDITAEANCSTGSFYTYFTNKEEIFAAVLEEAQEEMLHPHVRKAAGDEDPVALIEASNRVYLETYERNAKLMKLLEEVAAIDDDVREFRRRRGLLFAQRNARSIRDLQARGLADPDLDPELTARALSGMVGRLAFSVYVHGDEIDREDLVQTLTRLWANALRLDVPRTATAARKRPAKKKPAAAAKA